MDAHHVRGAAPLHVPDQCLPRRNLSLLQRKLRQQRFRLRWTGTLYTELFECSYSLRYRENCFVKVIHVDFTLNYFETKSFVELLTRTTAATGPTSSTARIAASFTSSRAETSSRAPATPASTRRSPTASGRWRGRGAPTSSCRYD